MDSVLIRFRVPIISVLVLTTLTVGTLFLYTTSSQARSYIDDRILSRGVYVKSDWSTLEGKIVMSLENNDLGGVYTHTIGESGIQEVSQGTAYGPRYSPDTTLVAFSAYLDGAYRLVVSPNEKGADDYVTVSPPDAMIARFASWAQDSSRIAFVTNLQGEGGSSEVDSWNVMVADPLVPGSARYVTTGAMPVFAGDESLLILKEDGLYRYTEHGTEWRGEQVFDLQGGQAAMSMRIDISDDATMLAWSNIAHKTIDIFAITAGNGLFEIEKQDEFPVSGLWPVFSPDTRYLAFESVESAEVPLGARLSVLDLESGESAMLTDLSIYDHESLSITDWLRDTEPAECACGVSAPNAPATGRNTGVASRTSNIGATGSHGTMRPPKRSIGEDETDGGYDYEHATIGASPLRVAPGTNSTLVWNTGGRDYCRITSDGGHSYPEMPLLSADRLESLIDPLKNIGYLPRIGAQDVRIVRKTTFTLSCQDPGKDGAEIGATTHTAIIKTLYPN